MSLDFNVSYGDAVLDDIWNKITEAGNMYLDGISPRTAAVYIGKMEFLALQTWLADRGGCSTVFYQELGPGNGTSIHDGWKVFGYSVMFMMSADSETSVRVASHLKKAK